MRDLRDKTAAGGAAAAAVSPGADAGITPARGGRSEVPPPPSRIRRPDGRIAHEMAARQRDISVAEFFQKNRHLLGFDSPRKALLTAVKEAVDNSLDACEEAGILPDIEVRIDVAANNGGPLPPPSQADRFVVTVTDNGPGIPKKNIGKVFAKLLYGSKFHRLRMSRGQQGIGISAAGMYGQLTTGKPTCVVTKIAGDPVVHVIELSIDAKRNEPVEHETRQYRMEPGKPVEISFDHRKAVWALEHGTCVSIELVGKFQKGRGSVEEYLELTAIANPHAAITYVAPDGEKRVFPRGDDRLPDPPREIKPHPKGIELGTLLKMAQDTKSHWLSGFLSSDFCRISPRLAEEICKAAGLNPRMRPRDLVGQDAEALYKALQNAKVISPPTDCLSPIGEKAILAGLVKTIKADFYTAVSRPPKVYRGNPFAIEVGIAYGKGDGDAGGGAETTQPELLEEDAPEARAEGEEDEEETELARVIRFANRVPLIYQQSACAMYKTVLKTNWRQYGVAQSRGAPPQGPMTIFIHMASVWVPFTSEAKEAVAEYDEIVDEVKLALRECGRRLGIWMRKRQHARAEIERRSTFQRYIEEVAEACKRIKSGKLDAERLKKMLEKIAEKVTGGEETDRILNAGRGPGAEEEERLEHSVERTAEGLKGEVPAMLAAGMMATVGDAETSVVEETASAGGNAGAASRTDRGASPGRGRGGAGAHAGRSGTAVQPCLFGGAGQSAMGGATGKAQKGQSGKRLRNR
ncbi:MAG: DNA topoisomerase VI subunit B [Planctomycetota bacterium]|nr:DNA topoisomerase VI subunit B [Planctomycetota bacterium]